MFPVLTREQSRELDQKLVAAGVPSLLLMENAGRGAAEIVRRELPDVERLFVVCGPGNNGGDGFVLARRWLTLGKPVRVYLAASSDALSPDARIQYLAYLAASGTCVEASEVEAVFEWSQGIVDALFGTGLSRAVEGRYAELIELINQQSKPVIALDIPSGLDANTGQALGHCVRAGLTVAFAALKRGCCTFAGATTSGRKFTVDIGAPLPIEQVSGSLASTLDADEVGRLLHGNPAGHKGQAGRVVVVAGAPGTEGAARLAAHGAFRAGAGVVTIVTHAEVAGRLSAETWEVMVRGIDTDHAPQLEHWLQKADGVVFGPGIGLSSAAADWLRQVVTAYPGVVVLDADGLTLLAADPRIVERRRGELVLTPHPGEAARLLGVTASQVEADRFAAVQQLSERFGATVVLKGAPTLVAYQGQTRVLPPGHQCLATAGSGDVLAGLIGALAATGLAASNAALGGAWLHARAGEQLGNEGYAARGLLAREIADRIPTLKAALGANGATPWQSSKRS